MKRSTILILIFSMVFSFIVLIVIQARYVMVNSEMVENQFDESVRRSLLQTVVLVEENEALEYLALTLEGTDYHKQLNQVQTLAQMDSDTQQLIDTTGNKLSVSTNKIEKPSIKLSTRHGKATIEETSKYLQERFRKDFSRSKTILDQAVFRWLRESNKKDISERVNFEEINDILEKMLTSNGVELPFYYSIVDKQGRVIFRCNKDFHTESPEVANNIYTQRFFR